MMTSKNLWNTCQAALLTCMLTCATNHAHADWMETFNGGFDQSWTFSAVNKFGVVPPSSQFTEDISNNQLDLSTSVSAADNGPVNHFGWVNETFTDARITSWATAKDSDNDVSLVLRADVGSLQGYSLTVDDDLTSQPRGLVTLNSFNGLAFNQLALGVIPDYVASVDDFFLEFSVVGNQLTGNVWSDATQTNLLLSLQATDNTYTSGVAAVAAGTTPIDTMTLSASFDDVTVTAVPEPSSAALLLSVGAIGVWRRRRRASAAA